MQVLISDANVLIDLEEGGLLELIFRLPYQFKVSDMLYHDELEKHHSGLLELGLQPTMLSPAGMLEAMRMTSTYSGPSRYDCFCMALAKQENCPLLTGDKDLRNAASKEGVVVQGTIWLVEQLINNKLTNKEDAQKVYMLMKAAGSRLPWKLAYERLENI